MAASPARSSNSAPRVYAAGNGAVPLAVWTAKAAGNATSAPAGAFGSAFDALKATRDPAKAKAQLDLMQQAYDAMRQDKSADLSTYEANLRAARERVAALPYLYGLPDIPKPVVGRHPAFSTAAPTSAQAAQARAWMAGYTGNKPSGFATWLAHTAPFLAHLFPSMFATPTPTPAFQKLAKGDQDKFLAVARAANPAGQDALHDLLVKGKLTPGLLAALDGLAGDRPASGIDAQTLLSETLVELNDPVSISQRTRGTCATTSVQIMLALREPTVYVNLLRGLASPDGKAKLPNGDTVQRVSDWKADNDGGRSIPSRLLQPSLMDYANGDAIYNNTDDMDMDPKTRQETPSGLDGPAAAHLLQAVTEGTPSYDTVGVTYVGTLSSDVTNGLDGNIESPRDMLMVLEDNRVIDAGSQDTMMSAIAAHAKPDDPVYCTVIYTLRPDVGGVGFHAVLVTGVKDGQVSYINPWGQEETLPADTFKHTIVSTNIREN